MYAQVAIKLNTLLRNGAYGIVMRGVQKCTRGCSSLRDRKRLPLCCIKLDTATDPALGTLGDFLLCGRSYRTGWEGLRGFWSAAPYRHVTAEQAGLAADCFNF